MGTLGGKNDNGLDIERLQLIFGGDNAAIKEFVNTFIVQAKILLNELIVALEKHDHISSKEMCHKLKGMCGNASAIQLYQLSIEQEQMILSKQWQEAIALHEKMLLSLDALSHHNVKCSE